MAWEKAKITELDDLQESYDKLLDACKGAIAALTQNKTFPADIEAAKQMLSYAIAKAEGRE